VDGLAGKSGYVGWVMGGGDGIYQRKKELSGNTDMGKRKVKEKERKKRKEGRKKRKKGPTGKRR